MANTQILEPNAGTTYLVDDLLKIRTEKWNPQAIVYNKVALKEREDMDRRYTIRAACTAYADALTALVRPFTFSKNANPLFKDDGSTFHKETSRYALSNRETLIGSVDVWAASMIDPAFAKTVRENIAVIDEVKGCTYTERFDAYDRFDTKKDAPDGGYEMKKRDMLYGPLDPVYGARWRLGNRLTREFNALMHDPDKRPQIERVRDAFISKFERLKRLSRLTESGCIAEPTTRALGSTLRPEQDTHYALAYLKQKKVTEITVSPKDDIDRAAYAKAESLDSSGGSFTEEVNDRMRPRINARNLPGLKQILSGIGVIPLGQSKDDHFYDMHLAQPPDRDTLTRKFLGGLAVGRAPT